MTEVKEKLKYMFWYIDASFSVEEFDSEREAEDYAFLSGDHVTSFDRIEDYESTD